MCPGICSVVGPKCATPNLGTPGDLSGVMFYIHQVKCANDRASKENVTNVKLIERHKRLAKKLQACGIRGQALTWIQSWLSGRRQKVGIGDKRSSWRTVLSGVPQGRISARATLVRNFHQ